MQNVRRPSRLVRPIHLLYNAAHAPLELHPPVHAFLFCRVMFQAGGNHSVVRFLLHSSVCAVRNKSERVGLGRRSGFRILADRRSRSHETDRGHGCRRGR
jgi:hypothetical protein